LLESHAGLLFLDRFTSLARPGIILSHSHWRDEASIAKWRGDATHYNAQSAGRTRHFTNYRIRISHVLEHVARGKVLVQSTGEGAYLDTGDAPLRLLTIIASEHKPFADGGEPYRSVNFESAFLTVRAVDDAVEGHAVLARAADAAHVSSAILAQVSRDYGMYERAEAPQYFPPPVG
jgi:hypothetical protein